MESIMNMSIELPEDIVKGFKALAREQETSLEAVVEDALRKVLVALDKIPEGTPWVYDDMGLPVARPSNHPPMTADQIRQCVDGMDQCDDEQIIEMSRGA